MILEHMIKEKWNKENIFCNKIGRGKNNLCLFSQNYVFIMDVCFLEVVLKLASGESHVIDEVGSVAPCRENNHRAHWFVFFLCPRFRPAFF